MMLNANNLGKQIFRSRIDTLNNLLGDGIAFGVNGSRIKRTVASRNPQKTGSLNERRISNAAYFFQLLSILELTFFLAMFDKPASCQCVETTNISQQRRTSRVHIHADTIHAKLNHFVQRLAQVFGFHIVLIHSDANVCRADLDQLRHWILQPSSDRNRATNSR